MKRRLQPKETLSSSGHSNTDMRPQLGQNQAPRPKGLARVRSAVGNAAFARLVTGKDSLSEAGQRLAGAEHLASCGLTLGRLARSPAQPVVQRSPDRKEQAPDAALPNPEDVVADKFPQIAANLKAQDYKAMRDMMEWRAGVRKVDQQISDFDRREREKDLRSGWNQPETPYAYRYLSSYQDKLRRLQGKYKAPPKVTTIEIDTWKLIDKTILDPQDWNIKAEKEFRESWVARLSSAPTVLKLMHDNAGEELIGGVFSGPYWRGRPLPTEEGLITWDKLLNLPGAITQYYDYVKNSPMARAANEYLAKLQSAWGQAKSDYDFERERKGEFPNVSRVSEFFSSEIDLKAAEKLLPPGKSFEDMSVVEVGVFLARLDPRQLDLLKRELLSSDEVLKIYEHLLKVDTAVAIGEYEAALITMPMVADEIQRLYVKTVGYGQRVGEGASSVVTVLQAVRTGCNIVLTVGGGVMGKAYGLVGVSAGSAAGAATGTFTQETAMQLAEGKFDPGSIMFKTGKDAAMTFVGSMIGGALGSKFMNLLGPKLAPIIPNQAVREFVIGRAADATSSLLTTPIEVTVDGMINGDWPKSLDDLMDKVASNMARDVIVGGAVDIVTGIPNLKGKEWANLKEADIRQAAGDQKLFAEGVTDAELEAAFGQAESGTRVSGPAGKETVNSLIDMKTVSRLNDQIRSLSAGEGAKAPPVAGPQFARSETEVLLARRMLADPFSTAAQKERALQVIAERAVADFRTYRSKRGLFPEGEGKPPLHSDNLRGLCGTGRDLTADSIASLTIGSRTPVVIHRMQVNIEGGAKHAFNVAVLPDGKGFIIDPTFAQFTNQIPQPSVRNPNELVTKTFYSEAMLSEPGAAAVARDMLRDGFVPLTPQSARAYSMGLGAKQDAVGDMAARIMTGDGSVLTDVVVNGRVERPAARQQPGKALDSVLFPRDPIEVGQGSIDTIEGFLTHLPANDPARPVLSSFLDRLRMIYVRQPQVTAEGTIGPPPSQ